jgi:hypothetical protein
MENVNIAIKGDILTITVDLSQTHGASSSGKSIVIASTQGNQKLNHPSGAVLGVNVYKKA